MSLQEIIRECLENGVEVSLRLQSESVDGISYIVQGFAKSGEAEVFSTGGSFQVNLRYDIVEQVESFEDLARICFKWCEDYKERGYGYGEWAPVFEKLGWIKSKTTTTTRTKTTWERT